MKIVHLCLASFYIDDFGYQENMIPKYHKKAGHDVTVIASMQTFDDKGELTYLEEEKTYYNKYGVKIIRLNYKNKMFYNRILRYYHDVFKILSNEKPDIIFIHGLQFCDINEVIKYIEKNPQTKVFVDNHADFSNSAQNWLSKNILHKMIWRYCAKRIEPYTEKFYGVLPARVDFLTNIYKTPKKKTKLLLMGADDEKIKFNKEDSINNSLRKEYNIAKDDFLIITGGKIDLAKKQIIKLIKAVNKLNYENVKLIIFGSIIDELKKEVLRLIDGNQKQFIGWLESDKVYDYFLSSDLGVFPGRHSVLWEQAVATGLPCVFKKWEGTKHVDLGGNCKFIAEDSVDNIKSLLKNIIDNEDIYKDMKNVAEEKGIKTFSYKKIARRSIDF
ncbi:glycosyltransferase family 4 protein [Selenihalanaerobacter shriftii]|uniref:Glycosyltransferase involved in cell wall bisynthesis n=1 Tax=Selenihalanaerobacter shriftii TaxID=142842 RepID=A0A1T4R130_9FIRM|nr:glycosyltransferase family 4 protein [Selenihalanaerobacter shriftii]SKA09587.1 Glycosyltransferase involved in cell wall bisynthesis [Selenihalanaerobacter shriftii]